MQNATDRFLDAITRSHTVVSGVDLIIKDEVADTLPISTGSVDVESAAEIRRRCSFTVVDGLRDWFPSGRTTDRLHPYGTVVSPWRGILYPEGDTEVFSQGRFSVVSIAEDEQRGTLTVAGRDFGHNASRPLPLPVAVPGQTRRDYAAAKVIRSAWPDADFRFSDLMEASTGPMLFEVGENALAEGRRIARTDGFNLYPDIDGAFILPPLPGALGGTVPVTKIADGEGGTLLSATQTWSSEDKPYNGVIVVGAAVRGRPVRYEIWDDNPLSLTYYKGPYGANPEVIVDDQITNVGQAQRQARARLQRHLGKGVEVPGSMLVNPALDADDMVILQRYDDQPQAFFIHSLTIPLGAADSMPFTLRRGIFGDEEAQQEFST